MEFDRRSRYIEPFVGSGAIFFALAPKLAVLNDSNPRLIETYLAIQADWKAVVRALETRASLHSDEFYYEERSSRYRKRAERAAQFIYLNRTCWNGLYRVNLRGEFNVPRGSKNSVLLDTDDFEAISDLLRGADLLCSDFESVIDDSKRGDFLFVDPPYTVHHNLNGFLKYNEKIFSWDDQIRLAEALRKAVRRGTKLILTNADHPSVRELYKGLGKHHVLERNSVISGNSASRKVLTELVVVA